MAVRAVPAFSRLPSVASDALDPPLANLVLPASAWGGARRRWDTCGPIRRRRDAAREKAEADRIELEYTFRCRETERQFDGELEDQAVKLGRELRAKYVAQASALTAVGAQGSRPGEGTRASLPVQVRTGSVGSMVTALTSDGHGGRNWTSFLVPEAPDRRAGPPDVRGRGRRPPAVLPVQLPVPFPDGCCEERNPANDFPPFPIDEYNQNPKFTTASPDEVIVGSVDVQAGGHRRT